MSNALLLRRRMMMSDNNRPDYLKFTAQENGCTVTLNKVGNLTINYPTEYSVNKSAFVPYTYNTVVNIDRGDTIEWRRAKGYDGNRFSYNTNNYYYFVTNGNLTLQGDITTLLACNGNTNTINESAFAKLLEVSNNPNLVAHFTIPTSVTSIGNKAFINNTCYYGELVIPNSLSVIREESFRDVGNNNSVTNVVIPNTITSIGSRAFMGISCGNTLNIPNSVTTIDSWAFSYAKFTGSIVIPDSVTSIGAFAFANTNTWNGTLKLSDNLTVIEQAVFQSCSNLTGELVLPSGITNIKVDAFRGCKFTGYVNIPATVINIGVRAFNSCTYISGYILNSALPPTIDDTSLSASSTIPIYVPYSADHSVLDTYKTTRGWSNYANYIFELNENGEIPE